MKLKFTKEELTTIRTLHNLIEEDESLHFKTNKDVKKNMEVMIRITTPRVFFDAPYLYPQISGLAHAHFAKSQPKKVFNV
jgi:hypothetical protein